MANLREIQARRRQKPSLAELRERKQQQKPQKGLATLRKRKQMEQSGKRDFSIYGVRYHNPQQVGGYWTIDVTNGDDTFTLHNRHGCWMYSLPENNGRMKEPVAVARMLGINMGQVEMAQNLTERLEREQRARGIPTRQQLLRQHEDLNRPRRSRKDKDE